MVIAINSNKSCRFIPILASVLFFSALLHTSETITYVREALMICGNTIIPSLFPFTVLTGIITSYSQKGGGKGFFSPVARLFGISTVSLSALVFGMLCGFPIGGKIAIDLYKKELISKEEAERLIAFTNNTGPAFAIGAVGNVILGSAAIGALIYFSQIVISVITGIILGLGKSPEQRRSFSDHSNPDVAKSISDASLSVLSVCGFVVFFYFTVQSIGAIVPSRTVKLVSAVLLEVSCGATEASKLPYPASAAAAAFSVGWAGMSVHMQLLSFSSGTGLKVGKYFTVKLLSGLFNFLVVFFAANLFPVPEKSSLTVFSYVYGNNGRGLALAVLILFTASFIISKLEKRKNMCYNVVNRRKRMCKNEKAKRHLGN